MSETIQSWLLEVQNLSVEFQTRAGIVKALENIHFSLKSGETVGVVGESGSGKSVLSYALMGLLESSAKITQGAIHFRNTNLLAVHSQESLASRKSMAMIFQNPRASLNPIRSVGKQILDVLLSHRDASKKELHQQALILMEKVNISSDRFKSYPFELSGGMCQRILIAMALAKSPQLLIADEPTTGLDVVTQEKVMELIQTTIQNSGMSTLFITHDLGLAARYCQRIIVMHAGHIVEVAPTTHLFKNARHPYTAKLIAATPGLIQKIQDLEPIAGQLPDLRQPLLPCRYQARCERHEKICDLPPLDLNCIEPNHFVACKNLL